MSAKINICSIISGHINTLKNASDSKFSGIDFLTFFGIPILIAVISSFYDLKITDSIVSLLVNFGAIFTALLLSVLVLVYDQNSKLDDRNTKSPVNFFKLKKELLNQLYYNICYSVILSLILILSCLVESIIRNISYLDRFVFIPVIVFVSIHLMLTIVMIVKRMHTLLTTD